MAPGGADLLLSAGSPPFCGLEQVPGQLRAGLPLCKGGRRYLFYRLS